MPKLYHCWRCDMLVPMLTDAEWEEVRPLLGTDIERIILYRKETGAGLGEAYKAIFHRALEKYNEITGCRETNPAALWHHYLSYYGPECVRCGHLLRTKRASFCANCGRQVGEVCIDWADISCFQDFYDTVFAQTGAPDWHGRNLDAIGDSWVTGSICREGPPFNFIVRSESHVKGKLAEFARSVREIAEESVRRNGGSFLFGDGDAE